GGAAGAGCADRRIHSHFPAVADSGELGDLCGDDRSRGADVGDVSPGVRGGRLQVVAVVRRAARGDLSDGAGAGDVSAVGAVLLVLVGRRGAAGGAAAA